MKNHVIILTLVFVSLIGLSSCGQKGEIEELDSVVFSVLYTNDEHGWVEGEDGENGAANLSGLWESSGYLIGENTIVLSGGDNWTGPAISTWFDGESMVDVMNEMGYTASVVGNHEFDFGLDVLAARLDEADFPYLSANIKYKESLTSPDDLGFQPYTIIEIQGIRIGLIGLTTTLTPSITNPNITGDFVFQEYEAALREAYDQVVLEDVDFVMVPSHICLDELRILTRAVEDLDILLFGGGHCHEVFAGKMSGATVLAGGSNMEGFAYATFTVNETEKSIFDVDHGYEYNRGGEADQEISEVIAYWHAEAADELDVAIGYLENEIPRHSAAMGEFITETWLLAYPSGDAAITNWGGVRDRLPAGDITIADIISVLPFDNVLIDVSLSGEQLLATLDYGDRPPIVGGLHEENGSWLFNGTDEAVMENETYSVLFNDFMYNGGDGYTMLQEHDPDAYNTAIDWRQPLIDWILLHESSESDPIDDEIESLAH